MSEFKLLQIIRFFLYAALLCFLSQLGQAGVSLFWLLLAVGFGVLLSGKALQKNIRLKKVIAFHLILFIFSYFSLKILNHLFIWALPDLAQADFLIAILSETGFVLWLFYCLSFFTTWIFWTKSWALLAELLLTGTSLVYIFSAHREYHVDAPKEISSLSWKLQFLQAANIQPQHIFMFIGALIFLSFCAFSLFANNRSLFGGAEKIKNKGTKSLLSISIALSLLATVLALLIWQINSRFNLSSSRAANGVGSSSELQQGQSNLGFHEAVSSTKIPTALLRLEGDYQTNPWKPMLYIREGALSEFNGRELVKAANKYDRDIPLINVGQTYIGDINLKPENRTELVQSIYLLSEHKTLFAVDYPNKFINIKNPYPEKFNSAYQAHSFAPSYDLATLSGLSTGEESWEDQTWKHYLRAPASTSQALYLPLPNQDSAALDSLGEDMRYLDMAKKLSANINDPIQIAKNFANYLSEESIYTKSPGHQVTEKGDPVAPYLFSKDKRGFCVHFAHAMVYLLRLSGIPARIATGYLTDLTYAKDGHILLQTGDRHAWPEVYVRGYGWLVFDVTPKRVENEEPMIPDESLLQELMGKLSPVEEMLMPDLKDTEHKENTLIKKLPTILIYILFSLLVSFLILKIWLRYAYLLPADNNKKVKLAYQAFASTMLDLNRARYNGETRKEYAKRLSNQGIDCKKLTQLLESSSYDNKLLENIDLKALIQVALQRYSRIKRISSIFNPNSITRIKAW